MKPTAKNTVRLPVVSMAIYGRLVAGRRISPTRIVNTAAMRHQHRLPRPTLGCCSSSTRTAKSRGRGSKPDINLKSVSFRFQQCQSHLQSLDIPNSDQSLDITNKFESRFLPYSPISLSPDITNKKIRSRAVANQRFGRPEQLTFRRPSLFSNRSQE